MKRGQHRIPHLVPIALVAWLCTLLLTGCTWVIEPPTPGTRGTGSASAPATNPGTTISAHLADALALTPSSAGFFAFTDWAEIKRIAGVEVTSADSLDDRLAFLMPLGMESQAIATSYAIHRIFQHAEAWGWDTTDLVWEANFMGEGPPVWVLRFRDDFDFAPVLARLEERQFTRRALGDVALYQHEFDLGVDWISTSELAIFNIAHLVNENTFILASSDEALLATLDDIAAGATLAAEPAARAVAAQLGKVGTAVIEPDGCTLLGAAVDIVRSPEAAAAIQAALDQAGLRHAFDYFGFGYRVESIEGMGSGAAPIPLGIFVHHYANATDAMSDLTARRNLAANANSLSRNIPYADLFEVVDATVVDAAGVGAEAGANLVLRLHALDRPPQLFLQMINQRDLLFAACGVE